jgi:hypothetical protein
MPSTWGRVTPEIIQQILNMRNSGVSINAIQLTTGVSEYYIKKILENPENPRPPRKNSNKYFYPDGTRMSNYKKYLLDKKLGNLSSPSGPSGLSGTNSSNIPTPLNPGLPISTN